jgi:hypothetical protein
MSDVEIDLAGMLLTTLRDFHVSRRQGVLEDKVWTILRELSEQDLIICRTTGAKKGEYVLRDTINGGPPLLLRDPCGFSIVFLSKAFALDAQEWFCQCDSRVQVLEVITD